MISALTIPGASWLTDTLLYTGALIALVLVLRRPVSRYFGPNVAYFLWALPLLRFIMPPLTLPASMAPLDAAAAVPAVSAGQSAPLLAEPAANISTAPATQSVSAFDFTFGLSFADLILPLWLLGAILLLAWRARAYRDMRRVLLQGARPAGTVGNIRLVETPQVTSPVAFGIIDKIVALPLNFMAQADVNARDLAIEHELSHHRGYDLVANIAAQPLLALHWFNPLAWWGWRAMRTDQEAACDARVVAGCEKSEKVSYAEVIAGFAAKANLEPGMALVSPMACPVLGEKSIIHRLRSLSMNEVSTLRRRFGLAAIGLAAVALPMTASISYAAPSADIAPVPLVAPIPPVPPLAPKPPMAPLAPDTPTPPTPPTPPAIESVDPSANHRIERDSGEGVSESEGTEFDVVMEEVSGTDRAEFEEAMVEMVAALEELDELEGVEGLEGLDPVIRSAMSQVRGAMGEVTIALGDARQSATMTPQSMINISVQMTCDGVDKVVEKDLGNGRRMVMICQSSLNAAQMDGLAQAHREISANRQMNDEIRANVLRQIEQRMQQLQNRHPKDHRQISHRVIRHSIRIRVS